MKKSVDKDFLCMKKSIARFLLLAFAVVPLVLFASLAAIVPAPKKIRLKDGVLRCRSADLSSVVTFGKDPSIPKGRISSGGDAGIDQRMEFGRCRGILRAQDIEAAFEKDFCSGLVEGGSKEIRKRL